MRILLVITPVMTSFFCFTVGPLHTRLRASMFPSQRP